MNSASTMSPLALESVLCTEQLSQRPARRPDYQRENRALVSLARALADSPGTILQVLADTILDVFQAGSAGISLVTEDGQRFYWPAIAGAWKPHIGGGTPRDFGPCGDVLDRDSALLFTRLERRYTYFIPVTPPIEECLLVPFYVAGKAVGTIWAIAHDVHRKFDGEDLRMLESLGAFASAAYQTVEQLHALQARDQGRRDDAQTMREMNEKLIVSSIHQHELTEQAQQTEVRYRRLFETAKDGILILDANTGRITDVNPLMIELWGASPGEFLGRELWEIGLFGDRKANETAFRELLLQGYLRLAHLPVKTDQGRRLEVEVIANVYKAEDHSFIQCNIRDITQRRALERQAREQADALAEVGRHKDEFLATLAHELRNPLAPIRNAVAFLGMEALPEPDAKSARDVIDRQVTLMVRLIDDLLDVSRISRNKLDIRKQRVDLAEIVRSAVESSRPLIVESGHQLTVSLPPQPVPLDADPVRLAQVFLNLLNNAAKYTRRGGHIWLTARLDGSDAVITVRDNGIGIPGDMLANIFGMFTQVDRSLEKSQGGLGIGLTLVRRLLEMHDGAIEAHSNGIDQGSEFVVRLPLPSQSEMAPPPGIDRPTAKNLSESRILIVDDNKDSADTLGMLLRLMGNDVDLAYDGLQAVEAAERFRPELMLLDIGLPKLNGYDVARRIRQQPWGQNVTLVALTGWGQDEDRRRSQEAGFNFHIVKPVEIAALANLLAKS